MGAVNKDTSAKELAALVSQALDSAGIKATLSGGGAVALYSDNEYQSRDLDFITNAAGDAIAKAVAPLGFTRVPGARQFEHPETDFYLEFPPGPLAFGETVVSDHDATTVETEFGPLRIVTPTQSVMDRLSAYVHWNDNQSLDQAVMVARTQPIDWAELREWARREGLHDILIETFKRRVGEG